MSADCRATRNCGSMPTRTSWRPTWCPFLLRELSSWPRSASVRLGGYAAARFDARLVPQTTCPELPADFMHEECAAPCCAWCRLRRVNAGHLAPTLTQLKRQDDTERTAPGAPGLRREAFETARPSALAGPSRHPRRVVAPGPDTAGEPWVGTHSPPGGETDGTLRPSRDNRVLVHPHMRVGLMGRYRFLYRRLASPQVFSPIGLHAMARAVLQWGTTEE